MATNDFRLHLNYPVDATTLYQQFATQDGVRHWWTAHCVMDERVGGEAYFPFDDAGFFARAAIGVLAPDREVAWQVTDSKHPEDSGWTDLHDWVGTTIRFVITPLNEGGADLQFTHEGLMPLECAESCSSIWHFYLHQSLRNYFTKGKGEPYRHTNIKQ